MKSPAKPRIYLSSPHMGGEELRLVQETFASNWIAPLGPQVDAFEKEFAALVGGERLLDKSYGLLGNINSEVSTLGSRPLALGSDMHAAALSSGTAALHLAMRWLGLKPGDEVLTSTLTFVASVNPVVYEGATPVFVDCDERSWNMAPALLAEAVEDRIKKGKRPKAVILVHLYGQSADIEPIAATCAKHDIPLIEDAAEALGAVYYRAEKLEVKGSELLEAPAKPGQLLDKSSQLLAGETNNPQQITNNLPPRGIAPGSVGLCGVHSFNGNKIITTSGGGMLVSNDKALIDKARFWATQARDPAPHYQHSEVGYNYRMSNVLAAIGRGQLRVLTERVEARRRNFEYYQKNLGNLSGIAFMPEAPWGRSTRWLTCLTINPAVAGTDREKIRLALESENIEARPIWKPMHLQPLFKDCACYGGRVAERLFAHGLCLPSGSNLTESDLQRVVSAVRRVVGR